MIICNQYGTCCNWKYCDKREDLDEEGCQCSHISEVKEVVHAKWEYIIEDEDFAYLRCSHCLTGNRSPFAEPYCSNCGAKMNLE